MRQEAPDVSTCQRFTLSRLGLIAVAGPEAAEFLQGQITSDIRELSATRTGLSSHCTHQGRVLACFRILRWGEEIHLLLPRERIPDLLRRLRMFILRRRVTLAEVGDRILCHGLAGAGAPALLADLGLPAPADADALAAVPDVPDAPDLPSDDRIAVVRLPGAVPRFLLLGAGASLDALWQRAGARARPGDSAVWTLHDIDAGLPAVHGATADTFIPQMLNLQLLGGVSFTKGCYTGQEVVARMQYLGRLKRRLYRAEIEAAAPPSPGDLLHAPGSASRQAGGWVVEAASMGVGRQALLVVAEIAAAEGGTLCLGEDGPRLRVMPPPYGFPSAG